MSLSESRATIIDTDPGIDDAVAILFALASPEFAVRGITTVAGNISLDTTTRNAGRLLALAGREDIPVIPGAAAPLSRAAPHAIDVHGEDGVGGVLLPEARRSPLDVRACEWMADLLLGEPDGSVDILALGPLTNVAKLISEAPEAAGRIGRVIAMGGAIREPGNIGPHAEFNIATDPEAAETVLRAALPLTLVPLDVTRRVRATRTYAASLADCTNPSARAVGALIEAYFGTTAGRDSRPLHDPCVMLLALRPDLFGCDQLALRVDTGKGPDTGALRIEDGGIPVQVAMRVDGEAALDLLRRRLG